MQEPRTFFLTAKQLVDAHIVTEEELKNSPKAYYDWEAELDEKNREDEEFYKTIICLDTTWKQRIANLFHGVNTPTTSH